MLKSHTMGQSSSPPVLDSTLLDPCAGDEWDRAVTEHPHATIFHTSAWAKVLCDTYSHTPFYLRFSQGDTTAALTPLMEVASPFTGRRGVSLPFSDFCEPLTTGNISLNRSILDDLFTLAGERKWKYVELRARPSCEDSLSPSNTFYAHKLDLSKSPAAVFEQFADSTRRAIRKAARSGLTIQVRGDEEAVREFYALHSATRRRHGIPPQPFSFFLKIYEHIIASGHGFIVVARLGAAAIASAMFFHFREHGVFKFGASERRYQEHRANNLVMWEGIKYAADLGLKTLHLGRTDLDHGGLRRFKLSLGATEEVLQYFRFDPAGRRWLAGTNRRASVLAGAIFRSLPLTVNQLAGTVLYPHLH